MYVNINTAVFFRDCRISITLCAAKCNEQRQSETERVEPREEEDKEEEEEKRGRHVRRCRYTCAARSELNARLFHR